MNNIFSAIGNIIALDKALDKAVFGHELGLFGQNATEEEMERITNAIAVVGTLLNARNDDEGDEYDNDEYDEPYDEPYGETVDEDEHPLIGRKYIVHDNSYITVKGSEVAGRLYGKTVTIVSAPYFKEVSYLGDQKSTYLFVDVESEDSGLIYSVLFFEDGLVEED